MSKQNCSNCYNGCTEITSDRCVKYTGVDVPILGIQTGDSLSFVEQAIITFLSSTIDGTGVFPIIQPTDICPIVEANLPVCDPLSLNNYLTGIVQTICNLNEQIQLIEESEPTSAYEVGCVSGVTDNTSTQDVLQQTIVKLCEVEQSLNTFITDVTTNYVRIVDINTYIDNYFNTNPTQQLINNRMVPFSAQPYFGDLSPFSQSGAGIGVWDRIFLCNGQNGTPDLRGRVPVGTTSGMGGASLDSAVDPNVAGNPTYNLNTPVGTNSVTLGITQIPSHTHTITIGPSTPTITPTGKAAGPYVGENIGGGFKGGDNDFKMRSFVADPLPPHSHSATINETGGGLSHANFQPGLGSYYIIYIP